MILAMAQDENPRLMRLGAFVHETGQHVAAWRHPGAHMHSGVSFAEMVETAQLAERGKFDFLFLADSAAVSTAGSPDSRSRMGKVVKFEPMTILSAPVDLKRFTSPWTWISYTSMHRSFRRAGSLGTKGKRSYALSSGSVSPSGMSARKRIVRNLPISS